MGSSASYNKIALAKWYLEGKKWYGKEGYLRSAAHFNAHDLPPNCLDGKVVVITGSNQGIGFEAAMRCAELGSKEVHLLCRSRHKGEDAAKLITAKFPQVTVQAHALDVSVMSEVRRFSEGFLQSHPKVDVLINNAGSMPNTRTLTSEGNEVIAATTYGGCMLLAGLLLPAIPEGGRIINVSSGGAYTVACHPEDLNFSDVSYDGTLFYAFAKRHQLIVTKVMAKRVASRKILVNAMHPGWADTTAVLTAMPDFHEKHKDTLRSAAEGADTIAYLAASPAVAGHSGLFWFDRKPVPMDLSWGGTTADEGMEQRVWSSC